MLDRSAVDEATTGAALLRLGTRLYRLQVEALEGLSVPLSVRQYRILERVDAGVSTPGELAELARRRPPTISRSADSLVRQKMLTRTQSPTDRRSISLALSEEGEALLSEARAALQELSKWLGTMMGFDVPELVDRLDGLYAKTEVLLRSEGEHSPGGNRQVSRSVAP